jgi:UDP:flavonoid glycosyltransferase YjiC (YdhE family)
MRIGLQTFGTRGDVRPFAALAKGLSQAGHKVTLVYTSPEKSDYSKYFTNTDIKLIAASSDDCYKEQDNLYKFNDDQIRKYFGRLSTHVYAEAEKLSKENDLVIGNSGAYYLAAYAEKAGIPFISTSNDHSVTPTKYLPPPGWPTDRGIEFNIYGWYTILEGLDREQKDDVNNFRKKIGLPPISCVLLEITHSPKLHLICVSSVFCKQQPDWENHRYVCGHMFLEEPETHYTMPDDLKNFIEAGEPPVFFTLGSPFIFRIKRDFIIETFIKASKMAGCRPIIQSYWKEMGIETGLGNDGVYRIGYQLPYKEIFPYCKLVVHHGGAGTTHYVTRAKRPSVVIECGSDTILWAMELKRIGLTSNFLHIDSLNAEDLATEIKTVLNSSEMKARAEEFGEVIANENSVKNAVEVVERFINSN